MKKISDSLDELIQHAAISKIALEDFDPEEDHPSYLDDLKLDHKLALLSLMKFVEKHREKLSEELAFVEEEPINLWSNVYTR